MRWLILGSSASASYKKYSPLCFLQALTEHDCYLEQTTGGLHAINNSFDFYTLSIKGKESLCLADYRFVVKMLLGNTTCTPGKADYILSNGAVFFKAATRILRSAARHIKASFLTQMAPFKQT